MHKEGKLKAIGMSNYAIEDYEELAKECTVQPAINQIEVLFDPPPKKKNRKFMLPLLPG